jgi:hypothetical protein
MTDTRHWKSRCNCCDKRIGPTRYERGLCARCEQICQFAELVLFGATAVGLVVDPETVVWLQSWSGGAYIGSLTDRVGSL